MMSKRLPAIIAYTSIVVFLTALGSDAANRPSEALAIPSSSNLTTVTQHTPTGSNTDAHFFSASTDEILKLLNDPQNRISEDFKVPEGMKHIVGFWLKIYAKYSLYHTLIYDREHHEVVYEVVDSRDLFAKGLSPIPLELSIKARINAGVAKYKKAIQQLIQNPNKKFAANTPGGLVVALWGKRSRNEWRRILSNVRTQTGQRDRLMDGISAGERFFPAMESIFKKLGVPPEITRLPLVESSFNLEAKSKADAVGIWQFLEKSAQEYLVVDRQHKIDERLSPIKATYAAARMFKRNYAILDDWGLAIIAYNHGAKNLIPIKQKYKGHKIVKLLKNASGSPLGYASRSFLACFFAALHAEKYRDVLYGLKFETHNESISIVKMKKPASVYEISGLYNISVHELRIYNPDIFDLKRKLPAGTRIVLPRKHGESIVQTPKFGPAVPPSSKVEQRGIASDIEFIEYIH